MENSIQAVWLLSFPPCPPVSLPLFHLTPVFSNSTFQGFRCSFQKETWPPSSSVELFTALHSPGGCISLLSTECVAYVIAHYACKGPTLDLLLCIKVLSRLNKGIVLSPWPWLCPWSPSFQARAAFAPTASSICGSPPTFLPINQSELCDVSFKLLPHLPPRSPAWAKRLPLGYDLVLYFPRSKPLPPCAVPVSLNDRLH